VKAKIKELTAEQTNRIIRMAWEDRTSFEQIERQASLTEAEVIAVMRRELKPSSFKLWRKRVTGRVTKHRKRFKADDSHKGSFE
jgi:uncharacterized protein (TIGR03643 family)